MVKNLHARLKNFPHELHDFHADILIDSSSIKMVDFAGFIDRSDLDLRDIFITTVL
jgi:hypothetical protein